MSSRRPLALPAYAAGISAIRALAALTALSGCSPSGAHDRFADAAGPGPEAGDDASDATASDTAFTTDGDPGIGGPCLDDGQCKLGGVTCATWVCDKAIGRCRGTADDTRCDDGVYCNGQEHCDVRTGCRPGPVVDCSSGDTCSIDACVEATHACTHAPRDADGDHDPSAACGGSDCDDRDPTVNSKVTEVCGNHRDDNCNGAIDETPCVSPTSSTCDDAQIVSASSALSVSLDATSRSVGASCASSAEFPRQIILAIRVPAGGAQDVDIVAAPKGGARVALAAAEICGDSTTETNCVAQAPGSPSIRMRLRALPPGTYPVYVFGSAEGSVDLRVIFGAPTAPAGNLTCGRATPLLDGTTTSFGGTVQLVDAGALPSACNSGVGPLVYRVDVPASLAPRDLRVRATPDVNGVQTLLGLRDAGCVAAGNELRCGSGVPGDLFVRALPAGTYYVTLAAGAPCDVVLDASLLPATAAPAGASCATAPTLPRDTTTLADLRANDDSIAASCLWPSPPPAYGSPPLLASAAYALELATDSDLLVVARPTGSDAIGVGLATSACTTMTYGCGAGYPMRLSRRALPAGSYRVVVESIKHSLVSLSTFVRPTVTAGPVGANGCAATPVVIPSGGGLFTGSTTGMSAKLDMSCDGGGQPKGGAPEVLYRLDLAAKSRVVLDAGGSSYSAILSVRAGATCPGVEVDNGCAAGFVAGNAFLDLLLDAGTYWVALDGYALASGSYKLDVRVAAP